MLDRIENFELPARMREMLDRGVFSLGVMAFASGVFGILLS